MKKLNVSKTTMSYEIRRRSPWMLLGLSAGIVMVLVGQRFEGALSRKIELVFFIPMIVYMSDIIGTGTFALFVRELSLRKVSLHKIFWTEVCVGFSLGLITGIPMALFAYFWFRDFDLSVTLAITMTVNGLVAVLTGVLAPIVFAKLKRDPALGTDEITTAVSDNVSMLIYLIVASLFLL